MPELIVNNDKKLKTLNAEFQENFPYLMLAFFSKSDWENARADPSQEIDSLDDELCISEVRTVHQGTQEISIHGNTTASNLEDNFRDNFGIYTQVSYIGPEGLKYFSAGEQDEMTLAKLNKYCEELYCRAYPSPSDPIYDNANVKSDLITAFCRAIHFNMQDYIHGIERLNPKKHYATGRNIKSNREYYASINDAKIEAFFCEWTPEDKTFYVGFYAVPPDKNRREFKKRLSEECERMGWNVTDYACYFYIENVEYDTFLEFDLDEVLNKIYRIDLSLRLTTSFLRFPL